MIVKTSQRRVSSTARRSAREAFRYIHQAEKGVTPTHTGNLNLLTEGYEVQREEFALIASMAKKSTKPVAHFILSWHEHEKPTAAQADEAAKIFCRELGVEEYAIAYAMHDDTKNRHLHIAVNRAHPESGKVLDIEFSVQKAHRALAYIERAQGWQKEAKAVFDFDEKGHLFRTDRDEHGKYVRKPEEQDRPKKSPGAQNFERRTGQRSAEQIAADDLVSLITGATSWKELHTALECENSYYVRRGSGAVLFVNGTPIKASAAHRDAGFRKLEERLGQYEPGPEPKGREGILLDRKAPLDVKAYAEERTQTVEAREIGRTIERERHAAAARDIKDDAVRNAQIVAAQSKRGLDPLLARDLLSVIALIERDEREALKARRAKERARRGRVGALRDYAAYLRVTGKEAQAEAFRYRNTRNYLEGAYKVPQPVAVRDFTPIKVGREIYFQRDGMTAFIDQGSRITLTAGGDDKATLTALKVAQEKWGTIDLRGSKEFRQRAVLIGLAAGLTIVNPGSGVDVAEIRHELAASRERQAPAAKVPQPAPSRPAPANPITKSPQNTNRDLDAEIAAIKGNPALRKPWLEGIALAKDLADRLRDITVADRDFAPIRKEMRLVYLTYFKVDLDRKDAKILKVLQSDKDLLREVNRVIREEREIARLPTKRPDRSRGPGD
jgi:hypothetical protein